MNKKLKSLLAVSILAITVPVLANSIETSMKQMDKQISVLSSATDSETFLKHTPTFIEAAKASQNARPKGLNDRQFKDYQSGLQQVIDVVGQAETLAKEGKLDEAKSVLNQLGPIKKAYHKKYK
ncbi:cytochrome B562 [Actinobacillus indolicus]|uniref:Cytochrome B562 n=1 Tax=Actinobacillus indolicus TaxID=51049 RepID=A0A4P7CGJ5_9PAST|nr:cytochrome b562 [Actinobacillus indolicus]QBQ63054.1 cytochrome B562 [Actinobacillus indolicus]